MPDLLSSDAARDLVDQLTRRVLDDERLYADLAVPEARHVTLNGVERVYWSRPKALGDCAALRTIVDEYALIREKFDPVDRRLRAGENLGAVDRAEWEQRRLRLMGLEFALRALADDGDVR